MKKLESWFITTIQSHPIRAWLFVAGSVLFHAAVYILLNEWSFRRGIGYESTVITSWDHRIPFIPYFIYIYSLLYVVPVAMFVVLRHSAYLFRYVAGFYALAVIHYAIFIFFPVGNAIRPVLGVPTDQAMETCQFFYEIDRPYNLFPSMHVSVVFFSAFFLLSIRHRLASVMTAIATLIFLSTLFTKQHYLLDGIAAIMIAGAIVWQVVDSKAQAPLSLPLP